MSTASDRLRAKNPVFRLKSESPKFKDLIRKKCRERWRENRWNQFDIHRPISEETLADIVKEDLKSMYLSKTIDDVDEQLRDWEEIQFEMDDEKLQWLISEYDKILDNEEQLTDILDDLNCVTCPICQKNQLDIINEDQISFVTCLCGLRLRTSLNLPQIKEKIMTFVNSHNNTCKEDAQFTIIAENEDRHIYMLCYSCSCFHMLL